MVDNMSVLLLVLTVMVYLVGSICYLFFFVSKKELMSRFASFVIWSGFIVHAGALLFRALEAGHLPLTNLYEATISFTWLIMLLFLFVEKRYQLRSLGVFIVPLAFISLSYALLLPKAIGPVNPVLTSVWLGIHVTLILLGTAAFALTFGLGIMYLLQERQLKSRKQGIFYSRLPSLEILDDLGYKTLSFGFPFLTLGIITGSIWGKYAWGTYWNWDPKLTWSLITWLIYAALLHGRLTIGWRGRKAAFISILGFLSVLFTFIGVNVLLKTIHAF